MASKLNTESKGNTRIRNHAFRALSEADVETVTSRELIGLMTQIRTGVRGRTLVNRYIPSVHKLALLLKDDSRFIKEQCTRSGRAIWSLDLHED